MFKSAMVLIILFALVNANLFIIIYYNQFRGIHLMVNVHKICNDVYEHYLQFIKENNPSTIKQSMDIFNNVLSASYIVEQYLDLSRKMFNTEDIITDNKDIAKKSFTSMCIIHSSTCLEQLINDELYKLGSEGLSSIFAFITTSYACSYFLKRN